MQICCCFQIHLQRSLKMKEENTVSIPSDAEHTLPGDLPLVLKSKLLIVDLAGSERIDKSGKTHFSIFNFFIIKSLSFSKPLWKIFYVFFSTFILVLRAFHLVLTQHKYFLLESF